ncbi:MAG TPA: type III-B CRISPR-associated protein Cas10/Cmr2 [Candidatus Thiothrix moscowensis]|uniref:type III-B CRISPR-associated protein Cas10/Cmr2 n=1 Tax=unclassified Thiothrix TaxID=2636184 RepID=UPI002600CEE5|nr:MULTISPECIES: type III-B CRISPR-associated protein Cas10/Cmr2 [unclassified Thiothrix]HRJ53611.1 type III-B CRISPR-associated protein Cas10/Cmr2 [Candidatus Thiothrix moscowensis]HRJ93692.1 type III-B CRISPR-associated protein Cas10/Cmr2 [Candidatus Thiothrix moscowensis]
MNNNTHYFHFTLGPVQGFVSQARRTRDFWAGSFILSWLAAVAMKSVHAQSGDKRLDEVILFPQPDADFMAWLEGKEKGKKPTQGSVPNRFKAAIDPDKFDPNAVTNAVQEAWKALAEEVWKADLAVVSNGVQRNIWERQINNFWDMSWVITEDENDSSALDKRKNWRTYAPPEEPGVKCAMMDGWQELSGEKRPNRDAMNVFWNKVRIMGGDGMKSDLRPNEALCAIAFVKRRFSRHFHKLDHKMKQGWSLKGWKVPTAVPSVVYMAAVHWLEKALNTADELTLNTFFTQAKILAGEYGEWDTQIKCLTEAWGKHKWKALDGNIFFESSLENPNIFEDQKQAGKVLKALNAVCDSTYPKLPKPTPFYAVLMMDGDSLGSHMSNPDKQTAITNGLAKFTKGVQPIVYQHNGFLMYAGGDDVLAILPLEDAIPCAAELRTHYMSCFDYNDIPTTLSGAIEFVHIKTPLTKVLHDAHKLLDEVAKDGRGRDALAIRVWKPGGLQLEWAQPWKIALNEPDETRIENPRNNRQAIICEMANQFVKNQEEDSDFSNKFFYKFRERFTLLNPAKDTNRKIIHANVLDEQQAIDLMTMEYLNSWGSKKNKNRIEAEELVTKLLNQCRPRKRDTTKNEPNDWLQVTDKDIDQESAPHLKPEDIRIWEPDGALLVRFLAQKGMEK